MLELLLEVFPAFPSLYLGGKQSCASYSIGVLPCSGWLLTLRCGLSWPPTAWKETACFSTFASLKQLTCQRALKCAGCSSGVLSTLSFAWRCEVLFVLNGNDTCGSKEAAGKYSKENCSCYSGLLNSKELRVSGRTGSNLGGEVHLPFELVLLLFTFTTSSSEGV